LATAFIWGVNINEKKVKKCEASNTRGRELCNLGPDLLDLHGVEVAAADVELVVPHAQLQDELV
jgi:hypothetical protein